jgi:hypothetical protein
VDERKKPAQTQDAAKPDAPRFPIRFLNSANTVLKCMKNNAHTVYQATQEGFPERTFSASGRIVNEFGKTIERTTSLMKRVIFWDWDSDSKR